MKFLLLLLALLLPLCASAEEYVNPMTVEGQYPPIAGAQDDYGIGDPFVMRWNGMYYMYPSTCEERVKVFTSRDLVNWTDAGYCTQGRDVYFAYAPEVIYWRGSFYMITSPNGRGHYILKSDSPLGPFELITGNFGHSIDGSFFKTDDGQLMMLFPDNWIIKSAMLDEKTLLPSNLASTTGATLKHWTEGPGLFRRGDWYYLTFTGNHVCSTGYQVSFASRKGGPRGSFAQREDATLLINSVFGDEFKGLGHSSNVVGPDLDSMYIAYHSLVSLGGPARLYNLDRLFTNNGLLYTSGPSNSPMPVPEMPDIWGDAGGELHGFTEQVEGYFAEIPETAVFTQEWNFTLNSGTATLLIGQMNSADVTVQVDQTSLTLLVDGKKKESAKLPEIGPADCLHTLRVEVTPEIAYFYVDDMRLLTMKKPSITASRIGAIASNDVTYGFMACTAEALGSSDNTALKLLPGGFSARHALNAAELTLKDFGTQEEMAVLLGNADYNVRIAEAGEYCFDLMVKKADSGKQVAIALDGQEIWLGVVPEFTGRDKNFTFTTEPVMLPEGDHTLTVTAEDVLLNRISAFAHTPVEQMAFDFTTKAQREHFITYGPFTQRPSNGDLRITSGKKGFALFGEEGYTDYALDVTFEIPRNGNGTCGILLRATDVSYYDAQVDDSYFGYAIALSDKGVTLRRSRYGQVGASPFEAVKAWETAETGSLHIEVRGSRVEVFLPGEAEPLLTMDDGKPFTHGMWGFFSKGRGLTVLECTVLPLE
ncbi:MAG: family 43 glycosylhydrolase [Clostridia bacterium]|nr:family 43 glycosylhydrolase [Clostridia bacterium]MBQ3484651.1 family 43 glycosylhydrolase [Clostridia bacterium]